MASFPPAKRRRTNGNHIDKVTISATGLSDEASFRDNAFVKSASRWNLEQDYEKRSRHKQKPKESTRLPIKTSDGTLEQVEHEIGDQTAAYDALDPVSDQDHPVEDSQAAVEPEKPSHVQIAEAKEDLAKAAELLNENPEEHIEVLGKIQAYTKSTNAIVVKLTLAAQAAIFKDIIPGYRIRPLGDEDPNTKLSKDIRRLRNFEQTLVHRYQKYIRDLANLARQKGPSGAGHSADIATVAISCACSLLKSVPHFNFRGDILQILVTKLGSRRVDGDFLMCDEALQHLFETDDTGNASLEAVSFLSKMAKARNFHVDERVLNLFLHLRLLSEFGHRASSKTVDKPEADGDQSRPSKGSKKNRRHFSKKERKIAKANKAIDKEMQEADAVVSHEERDQMQSETLKLVFVVYFRILKDRTPHLKAPVLEGLVKYAHLINQDFFGDILEALKDLIIESEGLTEEEDEGQAERDSTSTLPDRNLNRESLLCVITAFALLQGQDASKAASTLHLDLTFFIAHLYKLLYATAMDADIELSSKTLRLADPDQEASDAPIQNKVDVQTTIVLLIRSLQAVMLPENVRSVPPLRLAAFTKQLTTVALQLPEKSCTAVLGILAQVMKLNHQRLGRLWNSEERQGDGVFDALHNDAESSRPFAATVWEGELLRLHFSPKVKDAIGNLESRCAISKS